MMDAEDVVTEEIGHTYQHEEFVSVLNKGEILYQRDPRRKIARIIFNRPHLLNSMPNAGLVALSALVKRAELDDDVKVIVFEGMGDNFGTGADATELGHYLGFDGGKGEGRRRRPSQRRRMIPDREIVYGVRGFEQTIMRTFKVTICKVRGYCYGGHLQIAVASDIVIASEEAMFGHPAWRYLGPIFNVAALIETVGLKKAKEMLLTCRPLPAPEAERAGLVTRVVEASALDATVDDYIAAVTALPADGIAMGKAMIEQTLEGREVLSGSTLSWISHGWLTNLRFEPDEWNFVKERRDHGLTAALEKRDRKVPAAMRMGKERNAR